MRTLHDLFLPRLAVRPPLIWLLLAGVALLAGCATGGKSTPESANKIAAPAPPVVPTGPVVERLPEGRQGFVIRELPGMNVEAQRNFARATDLLQARNYAEAIPLLQKVVDVAPGVSAPYINLAIAYRQTEQAGLAEKCLQSALELIPAHPVASNEYGLLLRQAGRFAEAREIYENSLGRFPDYQPLRKNLGILCDLYLNDPGCALEQYALYSVARPEDEQVKIWMADLNARLGR